MNRPALSWLIFSLSAIGLIRAKCLADAPANGLTEAERRGGWKLLFDGKTAKGWRNFRKDKNLHQLNTDFDLYSSGKDRDSKRPLNAKASRDDIMRANNGAFIGLAEDY